MQTSMKLICDVFLTDCANTSCKPNSRNVSLASHMSSILGMWLVLASCILDSDKVAAVLDWEPPKDIKGV